MKYLKFIIALNKHLNNFFINSILIIGMLSIPLFLRYIDLFNMEIEHLASPFWWGVVMYAVYVVITVVGVMILVAIATIIDGINVWWNETLTPAINKTKEETETFKTEPTVTFV